MSRKKNSYEIRRVTLVGKEGESVVTLTRKYGVWFITASEGCLRLGRDFGFQDDSWGITEHAIGRVERRLGMRVVKDENLSGANIL